MSRNPSPTSSPHKYTTGLAALLMAVLCAAAYLPSLSGEFLIDDDILLTRSPLVRAGDGLWRLWLPGEAVDYWPVSNSSLWLEWRVWGEQPLGYRLTNLILHVVASMLLWRILALLGIPGAYLGGLLYAVHPVNAEAVAWISQRKTLLAMLFAQLATLAYLRSEPAPGLDGGAASERRGLWYHLALLAFAAALLSKISIAVFPALLAILLAWSRPLQRHDTVRLTPFFLLAAALVVVNLAVRTADPHIPGAQESWIAALLRASATGWFYLGKALWPVDVAFMYPPPSADAQHWRSWLAPLAAVAATAVMVWQRRSAARPLLFAWLFYWLALLPALGLTETAYVEDHYQHVALCAVTAIVAAAWAALRTRVAPRQSTRRALDAAAVALVAALALATAQRAAQFTSNTRLMRAAVAAYPDSPVARRNLGFALLQSGAPGEALPSLEEALRLAPESVDARKTLAAALARVGERRRAIEVLQEALRLRPHDPEALANLGAFLREEGDPAAAIPFLERSLEIYPDSSRTHCNLGKALLETGQVSQAIEHFEKASRLDPASTEARRLLELARRTARESLLPAARRAESAPA